MSKKLLMTWEPKTKRWLKKHGGKMFSVSCRQLGKPATKAASADAANAWWEKQQVDVEEQAKIERQKEGGAQLFEALMRHDSLPPEEKHEGMRRIVRHFRGEQREKEIHEEAERVFNSFMEKLGGEQDQQNVGEQVEKWLKAQQANVAAGLLDPTSYDGYRVNLNYFRDWIGAGRSVEAITSEKLEEFHQHLIGEIGKRREWDQSNAILQKHEKKTGMSVKYAKSIFTTAKQFITRLVELGLVPLPENLRARRLKFPKGAKKIKTFDPAEFKRLYDAALPKAPRTALYLILMANCGMYQNDISELGEDEVDLKEGTITRARSKTPDGQVVAYKLWPETLDLLRECRNKDETILNERGSPRVLVTAKGKPLVPMSLNEGRLSRTDNIKSAYRRLLNRLKATDEKPLKLIRKTSASILAAHPQYKFYAQYFLAHSPGTMADQHYVRPSKDEFFAALAWLREQYGFGSQPKPA